MQRLMTSTGIAVEGIGRFCGDAGKIGRDEIHMAYSVLFPDRARPPQSGRSAEPEYFGDLNLDQVVRPILTSYPEFKLDEFFYTPLDDAGTIRYRQDVLRDLKGGTLRDLFTDFSKTVFELDAFMARTRKLLSSENGCRNNYLTKGRMFNFAVRYCSAVSDLAEALANREVRSEGLQGIRDYLRDYRGTEEYAGLQAHAERLREEFSTVHYCMLIRYGTIRVRKYEGQSDLSADIRDLFARFRQGDVKDYRHKLTEEPRAEHVEAGVLKLVAECYPDVFSDLDAFCAAYPHFVDPTAARFAREIQFYLSWLAYIGPLREKGLPFCLPAVAPDAEQLYGRGFFDLALAASMGPGRSPVTNDFALDRPERILVVTGPNQGGKTTYARAFGQIHYLASLGLSVPGREASLLLFDRIYTHFEREEDLSTLNGKLQDDLERLHRILGRATSRSVLVINEIFSSTTLSDAVLLGGYMMDSIAKIGCLAVCVTFLSEIAAHGEETVSMMSTVEEDDPAVRTFRIVRKPPDGLAYALHIASRYRLTYRQLSARLQKKTR